MTIRVAIGDPSFAQSTPKESLPGGPGTQERLYFENSQYIAEWEKKATYPIRSSGYFAIVGSAPVPSHLVWLDNERVLFAGDGPTSVFPVGKDNNFKMSTTEKPKLARQALQVWNVRTGSIEKFGDINSQVCSRDGNLIYWIHQTETEWIRVRRPVGSKTELEIERRKVSGYELMHPNWLNQFTCEAFEKSGDARIPQGHSVIPLRPEHGILDRGPTSGFGKAEIELRRSNQVKLLPPGTRPGIPLAYSANGQKVPIEFEDVDQDVYGRRVQYAEFANTYVFGGREVVIKPDGTKIRPTGDWLRKYPGYLFLLKPSGEVEKRDIPATMTEYGIFSYYLTQKGIFGFSHGPNASGFGRSEARAGYGLLLADGVVTRVFLGNTYSVGVSPDGCKVAVAIARGAPGFHPLEVKYIDLCKRS